MTRFDHLNLNSIESRYSNIYEHSLVCIGSGSLIVALSGYHTNRHDQRTCKMPRDNLCSYDVYIGLALINKIVITDC